MKIALETTGGVNAVHSYEPGRVQIREQTFSRSLIVLPQRVLPDWDACDPRTLRAADLEPLLDQPPEVVILGTGETQVFPQAEAFLTLMDLGIGFEVMDNAAACRTYNVLLSEGRRAALALIFTRD